MGLRGIKIVDSDPESKKSSSPCGDTD